MGIVKTILFLYKDMILLGRTSKTVGRSQSPKSNRAILFYCGTGWVTLAGQGQQKDMQKRILHTK